MPEKPIDQTRSTALWLLLGILAVAAFLRLFGIHYGLPHRYFVDESVEVNRALKLGAGHWDWELARTLKGCYFYILFLEYGLYFLFLHVSAGVKSAADFALHYATDPTPFFLIGRVTTAVMGTATVGVLYLFGRRFEEKRACLAAAFFLAVAVNHVDKSHPVTLDVPVTFFTLLSLYFMTRITEAGTWRNYIFAGLFLTLATLTKINLVLLILPFSIAHLWQFFHSNGRPSSWKGLFGRKWILTLFGCLLFYLAANPGILVNLREVLERFNVFFGAAEVPDQVVINYFGIQISGIRFYAESFLKSFGIGIGILGAVGMVELLFARDKRHWIFLGFFLLLVLIMAMTKGMYSNRYALPLFPLFALYAGIAFDTILRRVRASKMIVLSLGILLGLQPFFKSLAHDLLYTKKDTRTLALEWFESHVPSGSKVLIQGLRTFPNICTIPLKPSQESLAESISQYDEKGDRKAELLRRFLRPSLTGNTYHLILSGDHLGKQTYEDYLEEGVQYAVVCGCEDDLYLSPQGRKKFPEITDIYLTLEDPKQAELLKRWEHTEERPGPEIRIYRILNPSQR